ncbi:very short patch repair endonuclease [Leisingera thetidis]|uniref:very short patch repair endonuclease n=1 Tax=Leisingera thetidis TaxID=2930199 RepID=UPI0021F70D60|nr:very short patch repair endonuclease [Leisingera thetidis]
MADTLTPERRSANMARIRAKDTKPEMLVRRLVHGLGYRYRLHRKDLPGKPDLVFGPRRKVIFVHGCFWHQHSCPAGRIPASRRSYWEPKLLRNKQRDAEQQAVLQAAGWQVLTIWECETKDRDALQNRLEAFLKNAE